MRISGFSRLLEANPKTIVGIKVVYDTNKHIRSVTSEKWGRCGYFVAVIPFLSARFPEIAVSCDFCVFWLEAAVCTSKETVVGIKVVYGTNKHIRSVSSEKWSRCGYFVAVIPLLTAAFLEIAVSRDFCVFLDFRGC